MDNLIAKRIAKTVMEKTGIVKRIDKKIVQQVIISNCSCLRYPALIASPVFQTYKTQLEQLDNKADIAQQQEKHITTVIKKFKINTLYIPTT